MVHRSVHIPVAVLAGALVTFAPTVAVGVAAPPAVGDVRTVDPSLHLVGAPNGRDLGGYRTTDGRTVRSGIVFRTDQLNDLTPADLAELTRLGVGEIDDLRTVYERALGPDRVPAGARANWYDMIGGAPLAELVSTLAGGDDLYRAFITAPGANQAVAGVLRDIAESGTGVEPGAVLFHCTAGKDRTGWTAAVLLTVLGVDRATVTEDYLLSNRYRASAADDPMGGVRQEWLDSAFDQVARSYGSFDRYVSAGLGLGAAEVDALKQRMLS